LSAIESHRAALVLLLLDSERSSIPALVGRIRVPIYSIINSLEEKEWWKVVREYRAAYGIGDTAIRSTPATTNIIEDMWAAHLAELQTVSALPKSPLGPSTEADWDAFMHRINGVKDRIRT